VQDRSVIKIEKKEVSPAAMGKRKHRRNIYNRKIAFSSDSASYMGTIDNISAGGVHVITDQPVKMKAGERIVITLAYADMKKDIKPARVIWADDSGFGAKFLNR
jgi:hypothetical protein